MSTVTQSISTGLSNWQMQKEIYAGNWCNALQRYLECNGYAKPSYAIEDKGTPQKPHFSATVTVKDSPHGELSAVGDGRSKKLARADAADVLMGKFKEMEQQGKNSRI